MNVIDSTRLLFSNPVYSRYNFPVTANNYYEKSQKNTPIKSSPAFKSCVTEKTLKVATKNKKSIFLAIAAFLGFAGAKKIKDNNTEIETKKEATIILEKPIKTFQEFSSEELKGIRSWEAENGGTFQELRDILRHKEGNPQAYLTAAEVKTLATFLKEKPEYLKNYMKCSPETSAKEILELKETYEKTPYYYDRVLKYCPCASLEEVRKITPHFNDLVHKEKRALTTYSQIKEYRAIIENLQKNDPQNTLISFYYDKYVFLLPDHIKEKYKGVSIKTTKIADLPTMTIDDLIEKLKFLKTPEGKMSGLNLSEIKVQTYNDPYAHLFLQKKDK